MKNCAVIFYLTITIMLLCLSPSSGFADPLDSWHWLNPFPQGNHLRGIAFGNGIYVAVGDAGTVITIPDRIVRKTGITKSLHAVTFGNRLFVAVGDQGTILTSPDGVIWTSRSSSTDRSLASVTLGNGLFIAIGDDGVIITSVDGETWTPQASGSAYNLSAVTYGNGLFVATERNYPCSFTCTSQMTGGAFLSSPDGIIWTDHPCAFGTTISSIVFGNDIFVAVGEKNVYVSHDGIAWKASSGGFKSVAFYNGLFMAVGKGHSATSQNGVDWTEVYGAKDFLSLTRGLDVFVAVGEYGAIGVLGDTWAGWSPFSYADSRLRSVMDFHHGNSSVRVGRPITCCSYDLFNRQLCNTEPGYISGSPYGGSSCSKDTGPSLYVSDIAHGNGLFVIAGSNGTILTSPDTCEWTSRSPGISTFIGGITFDNGRFVAAATDFIITSYDGITWTATAIEGNSPVTHVGFGDGLYVATGEEGAIFTSTDGLVWDRRASGTTSELSEVAFGNGLFVTAGSDGTVLFSADGISWQPVQLTGPSPLSSVAYGGGYFVVVGQRDYGNGNIVFSSQDGITWTERFVGTHFPLYDVTYTGNGFIISGENRVKTIYGDTFCNTGNGVVISGGHRISLRSDPFCAAYLSPSLRLTIPLVSFGGDFFSAELQCDPEQGPDTLFRLKNAEILLPAETSDTCGPAVLYPEGDVYRLHIPEVIYNGTSYTVDALSVNDPMGGILFRPVSASRN